MKIRILICLIFLTINNLFANGNQPSDLTDSISNKSLDELVYTPAGPALKSKVHLVDSEHHLNVVDGHIQIIHTKTGLVSQQFNTVLFKNRRVDKRNGISNLKSSESDINSGWITDAWLSEINSPINYFSTTWVVPSPPPSYSKQLIYLFNGLESWNSKQSGILQPVLQWGLSPAGGGNYWAITNWYVLDSNYFHGSLIRVYPGDSLQGIMKLTTHSKDSFNYNSTFNGYPSTALQVNNIPKLYVAWETLEVYGITKCTDYPADNKIEMSAILIKTDSIAPSFQWNIQNRAQEFGQHTNIITDNAENGKIDIYFRSACAPTITWENPADITQGTILSTKQLNASTDVKGTFVYFPSIGTKLDIGDSQPLKVVFIPADFIGFDSISKTITINVIPATDVSSQSINYVTLYPNPATDNITIESPENILSVFVTSIDGKLVRKIMPDKNTTVSISINGLSPGLYFVSIRTSSQLTIIKKLVVNSR